MSVLLDLRKCGSMTLDRLTNASLLAIQLHGTFDLERGRIGAIARNTDDDEPFLIGSDSVVDDLCAGESCVSVKYFLRRGRGVRDRPVVHRGVGDHAYGCVGYPLPKDDVFIIGMRLDLLLGVNVKNLQCPPGYIVKLVD